MSNTRIYKRKALPLPILNSLQIKYPAPAYDIRYPYWYKAKGEKVWGCHVFKDDALWANPQGTETEFTSQTPNN